MENVLNKLFKELHFLMGGYEKETDTIWMSEGHGAKLVATKTSNGIVCVCENGEIFRISNEEEMENVFLSYFK